MPIFQIPIWSISELTRYLRDIMESDPALQDMWVQGEISNLSRPSSGHAYFTLKDASSSLRCVMWRNSINRLDFIPRDGQAVEAHGSLNIYEAAGQYQLYVDLIRPAGEGALFQEFLRLKTRLEAEGLFDIEHKRPIPAWPKCIGVVTSPTGAALRDILNTIRRRYPLAEVVLAPTSVQGDDAPPGIVAAIQALNRIIQPDVILVARGGGSIEDLWAFNDERVARAIYNSQSPVISGIGHETDFTISDFVSDLRAPTPTAAAELATPDRTDLQLNLNDLAQRLNRSAKSLLSDQRWMLQDITNRMRFQSPITRIRSQRQQLDEISRTLGLRMEHRISIQRAHLEGLGKQVISLNPLSVLQRGFATVSFSDGSIVSSAGQVTAGDILNLRMKDGTISAQARQVNLENQ